MEAAAVFCLLLLLATTTICSSVYAQQTYLRCVAKDRDALLSFRAGITRDPQKLLASWNGQDCCQWSGVKCSNSTGRVIKVDLRNKFFLDDLYGPQTPMDTHYPHGMLGKISSSLLALHHLRYLDLSGNHLGGVRVPIPKFLGSLRSLTYLNLSSMDFNGPVPPQLGNLSRLQYLDINNYWSVNDYNLHSEDISWLERLPSLRFLNMSSVSLSTIGDWIQVVNMLPNLRVLHLVECHLVFPYTPIAHPNLTSLEMVDLKDNRFTLNPTYWFWHVGTIRHLDLRNNMIAGTLPEAVGNMTSLEVLHLGGNQLNDVKAKPLKSLCNLRVLTLWSNRINQDMSEFLKELPPCARGKLESLDLSLTNVSGEIPSWIYKWTDLGVLKLSSNRLVGSIPLEIGMMSKLNKLYLDNNQLTGSILEEHLANLENLEELDLSYNSIHMMIRLRNNTFSGSIPVQFTDLGHLQFLDLAYNRISGSIPHSLSYLRVMTQDLQQTLGNPLVWSYERPANPDIYDLQKYDDSLEVVMKGQYLNYTSNIIYMVGLDLSHNNLVGEIPYEITSLVGLRVLNISHNQLSGKIPEKIGLLRLLESLDLSWNELSGEIPPSLSDITMLSKLNLSYNNLSGRIPSDHGLAVPWQQRSARQPFPCFADCRGAPCAIRLGLYTLIWHEGKQPNFD
ncbi:hypothetical protein EJB05_54824, partial [Eragrostis curvula]